jgi:transposase
VEEGTSRKFKRTFLPAPPTAYAPELNPGEGVWQQLKGVALRNLCCFDLRHLRDELRTAVKRVRRKPRILKGCFAGAGL